MASHEIGGLCHKLVLDAVEFFRSGWFDVDVVDLLIQIAADVLDLHIFIYQKTNNHVEVQSFHGKKCVKSEFINPYERVVCVLFSKGAVPSGRNHYDTIWCIKKGQKKRKTNHKEFEEVDSDGNGDKVSLNQPQMKRCRLSLKKQKQSQSSFRVATPAMETEVVIDLTESDAENREQNSPECIIMSPIKKEPNDDLLMEHGEDIFTQSDTTYVTTDLTDIEPLSSPTYMPQSENENFTKKSKSATSTSEEESFPELEMNFDEDVLLANIAHGKPFPTWYFANKTPIKIDSLPMDVDGTKFFKIPATTSTWKNVTKDLHYFTMVTSSCEGFLGEIRIGKCLGSYVCRNQRCPFVQTSKNHVPNRVSWRSPRGRRNVKICAICDETGQREGCGARKLVEFDDVANIATVYHIGHHNATYRLIHRGGIPLLEVGFRNVTFQAKQRS